MEQEIYTSVIGTIITLGIFAVLSLIIKRLTKGYARASHLSEHRTNMISKYIDIFMVALLCVIIIAIWGIKTSQLFAFITGTLTVIGVAFFAQWSILSNITSGMILFFSFPAWPIAHRQQPQGTIHYMQR